MTEVQAALERMEEAGWQEYLDDLRRRDFHADLLTPDIEFTRSDAGHPLGRGFPAGRSLRADGETHRQAWMRMLRADVCAYCGGRGGTVDHVEPQRGRVRGLGGAHCWLNYVGACQACNGSKSNRNLLTWMLARASGRRRI